ncbi:MAG: ankyrin repeat domain-containing protein, partial [Thermoplasmatota archaeon]
MNDNDIYGCTALMYSVRNNKINEVRLLLKNKAKTNLISREGFSALH